ncbi:type II secretion system protein J [Patescibacteria group bacterium]
MIELKKNQRGFTLQEVMVMVFVIGLLSVLVSSVFVASNRVFRIVQASVDLQTDISRIQTLLQRDIRGAAAVSQYPEASPTYTSDDDTLVLRMASIETDGSIVPSTYDYIIYTISGPGPYTLTREQVANGAGRNDSTQVLSKVLIDLTFMYDDTPITDATEVIADLALSKTYQSTPRSITATIAAKLRN